MIYCKSTLDKWHLFINKAMEDNLIDTAEMTKFNKFICDYDKGIPYQKEGNFEISDPKERAKKLEEVLKLLKSN